MADSRPSAFAPRAGAALLSGLLLVLVFPKFDLFPLAWVALVPLLLALDRESSPVRQFLLGALTGWTFFAGACYWIYTVMRVHGGLGVAAAAGVFTLFFLAYGLYGAVFAWLAGRVGRAAWGPLAVPFLWVAVEYGRAHLLFGFGFPWLLLGYALTDHFAWARVARWTGVYGCSFLLLWVNAALAWLWTSRRRPAMIHLAAAAGVLLLLFVTAPGQRTPGEIHQEENQRAYLVQTNIPQETGLEPWNLAAQAPLLARLQDLTVSAAGRQEPPALIVWPEMPAPFYYGADSFTKDYVAGLARRTNSHFLMGIVAFVPDSARSRPLNSAILLGPGGGLLSQYDKIHLVPFGEYVPLAGWLSFAGTLTAEVGDFVPGRRAVVSTLAGGRLGAFICYEAIFPDLVRRFVSAGAEVLVNISNDGWFGNSAARYQHLLMARMRAVENGRYLLRATNTGITAVIRPDGSIGGQLPPDQAAALEAGYAFRSAMSFYSRHGDWFAWACCVIALLAVVAARRQKRKADR